MKHPVVYINLGENSPTTLFQSKVGGKPYLPIGMEYPKNRKTGNPLTLLAQINFAEMPPLPDYPTKGILQFFVDRDDEYYGKCGDDDVPYPQISTRVGYDVVYHADILPESELLSDFSNYPFYESGHGYSLTENGKYRHVLRGEFPITFSKEPIIPEGGHGHHLHQIGGEPEFIQGDIFDWVFNENWDKHHKLLFQLDSEYVRATKSYKVIWGDCGIANFFITPEDLKNLDFSKVVYSWAGC